MMHDFLNMHPDVVSWYEPRTIWVYADPKRSHDMFTAEDATPKVKKYIRGRFMKYQRQHGNLRVMEKTPSNMLRIPYVDAIFPEATYIYIARNPLSYLSSSELKWRVPISMRHTIHRFLESPKSQLPYYFTRFVKDNFKSRILKAKHVSVWGVRYPGIMEDRQTMAVEEVIAKQWAFASQQAEQDLANIEEHRLLRFRYEDFVRDPEQQFSRILTHCNLKMHDRVVEQVVTQVDPGRQEKWKRLDPEVLKRCRPHIEEEMLRHGYEFTGI